MALSGISFPNKSADVVAIYDQNFTPIFQTARPMKATVDETVKPMEHPVETGAVITDHFIVNPTNIELPVILTALEYTNVYAQLAQAMRAGTLVNVQTRTALYQNMMIAEIPHEEEPDLFNVIAMSVKFHEVQMVTAQYGALPPQAVKKKTHASTVDKGQVQTENPSPSVLRQVGTYVTDFFSGAPK